MQPTSRRRFLAGIATASAALAAGCSGGASDSSGGGANGSTGSGGTTSGNASEPSSSGATTTGNPDGANASTDATTSSESGGGETTTVAAGPDGRLVFEPAQVEVSVGDTVVWEFKSAGHNVSAVPKDSEKVSIPDGATPFASYESGNRYSVVPEGKTYKHTFETPGEYTYVCIPHVASGMVGTVTVTK